MVDLPAEFRLSSVSIILLHSDSISNVLQWQDRNLQFKQRDFSPVNTLRRKEKKKRMRKNLIIGNLFCLI